MAVQEQAKSLAGVPKTFAFRNHTYTVTGTKPGRSFDWVLASREDGRVFKFRPTDIEHLTGTSKPKRPDQEIINDLQDVECQLSPENLTCDGELARSHVERRRRELTAKRQALVIELGREPTAAELFPELHGGTFIRRGR